jgi:hypothetical protein
MNDEIMVEERDEEEYQMVPERDFWERTSPLSLVPKPIAKYFFMVKERFGMDIANLVIFAYKEWGKDVAIPFAKKLLEFNSFDELIRFLQKRAKRIGEGRELLNNLIFSFQYSRNLEMLIEEKKNACEKARDLATNIFHLFASVGLFYAPQCIVQIAEYEAGCREKIAKRCKRAYTVYKKLKERRG